MAVKSQPDDVLLVLRPIKAAGPHPYRRLARLLKSMKRGYGFRCVSVGPASLESATLELLDAVPALSEAASDNGDLCTFCGMSGELDHAVNCPNRAA